MPISNNVKFEKMEKKEYEAIPASVYQVQIMDIKEKMKVPWGSPQGTETTELYLSFEFGILEGKYKGRKLWKDAKPVIPVPPSGGYKASWLYKIISAAVGHWLSQDEGINFGPEETNALIGRQVRLVVNQTPPKDGKSYNNITDILPVEKDLEPLVADNNQSEGEMPVIEDHNEVNVDNIPF